MSTEKPKNEEEVPKEQKKSFNLFEKEIKLDVRKYLEKFSKENSHLPYDQLDLTFLPKTEKADLFFDLPSRIDTPYQFILTYKTESGETVGVASVGFSYNQDNKEVCIDQIQAIRIDRSEATKESSKIISGIRWEKMLVNILEDVGHQLNLKTIKILKSPYNEWRYEEENDSEWRKEHNDRLKMRYDTTAKRMGFKADQNDEKYWSKPLKENI